MSAHGTKVGPVDPEMSGLLGHKPRQAQTAVHPRGEIQTASKDYCSYHPPIWTLPEMPLPA
jgi:hypothetical protein